MMRIQPAVRKETAKIGIGTAVLSVIMLLVFALLGRLDWPVVFGTLIGACAAVGNFFLMALSVQQAAEQMNGVTVPEAPEGDEEDGEDKPKEAPLPEVQRAKRKMQLSYTGRMLGLVVVAILVLTLPCFHPIPAAIALLFPRIVIFFNGILESKRKEA